jgi:hypothetical protein
MSTDTPDAVKLDPVNQDERIETWFMYHPSTPDDREKYEQVRASAKLLAYAIVAVTPKSADQTAALRKLRECVMTANAAIACKGV